MILYQKVPVKGKYVEGLVFSLGKHNLVVLKGQKGYVMCGYLNMEAAEKFSEVAVQIKGVATLEDVLAAEVFACTSAAEKLGIHKGQPIKDVLEIIA